MRKINYSIVFITVFALVQNVYSQDLTNIDLLLTEFQEACQCSIATSVSKKGEIIYSNYLSNGDKATSSNKPNAKFFIGSLTKQFTAASILLLQEQGKLTTSDYISEYLTEFEAAKSPIKIEHLLTHTSGIARFSDVPALDSSSLTILHPSIVSNYLSTADLRFQSGSHFEYSNSGYIILSYLIEKLSGISYSQFLTSHIFKPLLMDQTQVQSIPSSDDDSLQVHVYNLAGAGNIISTAADLSAWSRGLFTHKIINENSLRAMTRNYTINDDIKINQGFGWEHNLIQGNRSYEHSGSVPGYEAYSIYLPKDEVYVIVLKNSELLSPSYPAIHIAATMIKQPYPTTTGALTLSKNEINNVVGTYELENGELRYVGFDDSDGLFYKIPGALKQKLYALNTSEVFFEQGYRTIKFTGLSDIGYRNITIKNRIIEKKATKTKSDFPIEKTEISASTEELSKFIGVYVSEEFKMEITLVEDQLFAQPEGSDKLQLRPIGPASFMVKEIGAEVEFKIEVEEPYIEILIDGNIMIAKKIK